jgi:hypothetical protein
MTFPNIDVLSTNRADTLVHMAKAFTDYTEEEYRAGSGFRTSKTSTPASIEAGLAYYTEHQ